MVVLLVIVVLCLNYILPDGGILAIKNSILIDAAYKANWKRRTREAKARLEADLKIGRQRRMKQALINAMEGRFADEDARALPETIELKLKELANQCLLS
jgi:hypothetical protein